MNNQQEKTVVSAEQRRAIKKMAHHLKPVVIVGAKGLGQGVINEIDQALKAHELIKIQVHPSHKKNLDSMIEQIVLETFSAYIDTIGNVVILYRERPSKPLSS